MVLRVSRAFWVSPQSQTDTDGVLIRNVSSARCELRGPIVATVSDPGYPDLRASGFSTAIGPGSNAFLLAPGKAAAVLIADSHGCARLPTHRYHYLTLTIAGHDASVLLPDRSASREADFNGRRLSLAVDVPCGPMISGFLAPPVAPHDAW